MDWSAWPGFAFAGRAFISLPASLLRPCSWVFCALLVLLPLAASPLRAHPAVCQVEELQTYHFNFNQDCVLAYEAIVALKLKDGRAMLQRLRQKDPYNLVPVWLEDYADFFEVYIDEDPAAFQRLEKAYHRRLQLLSKGPANSPWSRYAQANVMLHWALARLKFGEYVTTLREARRAYKLLQDNLQRFPEFVLTRKELGVLQAAVATVPSDYRWGLEFLTGMEGDLDAGKRNLEKVIRDLNRLESPFLQETTAIYAFLLLNLEREEDEAWARIQDAGFDESRSLLGAFVKANIAMRTCRNDEAIRLLNNRPKSAAYYPFPYLEFMLGVCLQRKLDPKAQQHLQAFLSQKQQGNFIKEAYQKLAWQALIENRPQEYYLHLQNIRQHGQTIVGSDRNALREAELMQSPQVDLLKARLLFDGGYYDSAEKSIQKVDQASLSGEQRIEFPYRAARISAARKQLKEAETRYKNVIAIGRDEPAYFACKSAVELGLIAERRGDKPSAKAFYQMALEMKPSEYGPDLHHQAKAGLARL